MASDTLPRLAALGGAALLAGCLQGNPDYLDPPAATSGDETTAGTTSVSASSTSGATLTATSTDGSESTVTTATTRGSSDDTTDDTTDGETEGTSTGVAPWCGDGVVDPGEECDDGNDVDDDSCTGFCALPMCGDEIVQAGEACDHGPQNGVGDTCTEGCQINVCGDGILGKDEECDDGDLVDGDGCNKGCLLEACGNGVVDPGEACDDGNDQDLDLCTSLCLPPPKFLELLQVGESPPFGPGGGDYGGNECAGMLVGLAGDYDLETNVVANFRSLCSDVALEAIGGGLFRLRQIGGVTDAMDTIGGITLSPQPFSSHCTDPSTLLWSLGGWTSGEGIHEFALHCAEILVKPVNGQYKVFPQPPVMQMPVGMPLGVQTPIIDCSQDPGAFVGGFEVEIQTLVSSIRFRCYAPLLEP